MITLSDGIEMLGTVEAARFLGRSPQTLRQWACEGRGPIKPVKMFGRLLWPKDELLRFISSKKKSPKGASNN